MHRSYKRKLVTATAVLAAVAFAGGAYAATQTSTNPQQAFLNDVAKRLNVTPQQLQNAIKGASLDQLQAEVSSGRLTQAEANMLKARIEQGKALGPALGFLFAPGHFGGPGGPGGPGMFGGPRLFGPSGGGPGTLHRPFMSRGPGGALNTAASYLGLTPTQLSNDLSSGKTIAQIASSRGKSVSGLEQAVLAPERTRLQRLVSAKVLSSAQEQKLLSAISASIAKLANERHPQGFGLFRLGAMRFWSHGPGSGPNLPKPGAFPSPPSGSAPGSYAVPAPPSPPASPAA